MTELFEQPHALRRRFTPRQIAQGFGLIIGPAGEDPFMKPLWDTSLPWRPRERLLRAIVPLYERLFDVEVEIAHVPFMLRDTLLGYRYLDPDCARHAQDSERIQTVVVEVLEAQLRLDGAWSTPSALHGAHHANHPRGVAAVRQWLANSTTDDAQWRAYAERVLCGDAM